MSWNIKDITEATCTVQQRKRTLFYHRWNL